MQQGGALFEKLILDGFQAGLSWITILRKRDAFRTAFANFDPEKIARFDAKAIAALMDNSRIIRNRAKIEGTVVSARAWLEIETREGFSNFLWKFFDGRPQQNGFHSRAQIPTQSAKSVALSKGLKERGFKFCGPRQLSTTAICWTHETVQRGAQCFFVKYSRRRSAAVYFSSGIPG